MPKPYSITFTDLAKAVAEASSSLTAVEAKARAEIDERAPWAISRMGRCNQLDRRIRMHREKQRCPEMIRHSPTNCFAG